MKLEGSLETFPLRELIDMIVYSSVTGVLNIYGPGEAGHLYFRDSVLYHVERGRTRGIDALAELLEQSRANFSFVSEVVTGEETLYGAVAPHLDSAERVAARWRQIRAYVPSLDLIPQLLAPREAMLRRTSPVHYPVLQAIDGRASLRQISAYLDWGEIDVAEAAAQMSLDGLIDLRPARGQPTHAALPSSEPHHTEGIFDRILARAQLRETHDDAQRAGPDDLGIAALRS